MELTLQVSDNNRGNIYELCKYVKKLNCPYLYESGLVTHKKNIIQHWEHVQLTVR